MDTTAKGKLCDREHLLRSYAIEFSNYFEKDKQEHKEVGIGETAKLGQVSALVVLGTGSILSSILRPIPLIGTVFNKLGELAYGKWNSEDVKLLTHCITTTADPQKYKQLILTAGVKFALAYEQGFNKAVLSDGNRSAICTDASHRIFSYLLTRLKSLPKDKDQQIELTEEILLQGIIQGQSKQNAVSRLTFGISKSGNLAVYMIDGSKLSTAKFLNATPYSELKESHDGSPFDGKKYKVNDFMRRRFQFEPDADDFDKKWWDEQKLTIQRIVTTNGDVISMKGELDKVFVNSTLIGKKVPIWFEVGKATRNFVGREKQLEGLTKLFNNAQELVVTITGMGGVGKSELAKNFAKQTAVADSLDCIWLNGDSGESLKKSINRLESFLNLSKSDEQKIDVLFTHVISKIKGNFRILVIIDNVDEANEDVQRLISKMPVDRCFLLVTSRNVSILEYAGPIIKLATLSNEAAIKLVQKSGITDPDDEIMALCTLLGNFPLALHQAVAYIKMQKHTGDEAYKISDYLEIYESQKPTLLGHQLNLIEHEYRKTTLITWNISFEKIRKHEQFGKIAIQLLNTIAYFEPDGIHLEFLNLYQPDLEKAISLIKTYSLVKFENGVISIHRLIQQVIRLNLSSDQIEISQLIKIVTAIKPVLEPAERFVGLNGHLDDESYIKSRVAEERSFIHTKNGMGHIVSVLKHAAQHSQLLTTFKNLFLDSLNNLRYFWLTQHIVDLCHAILDQTKCVGLKTEFILRVESELTYAQCTLDTKFNQSKLLKLKNVYFEQLSILGEKDESTLITAHYIAHILLWYGHKMSVTDNAKNEHENEWCRNVVELKTKVFRPLHKSTLSTKLLLAHQTYRDKNYHEAVELYEECFQWQMTHLGAEGSGTYDIFQWYVTSLLNTDNCEEALCVVEQHLQQDLIQSKHRVYEDLSLVLFCLGEIEEAFSTFRRAIKIKYINYEFSNFDSNLSKYNDANILLRNENYSKALEIYRSFRRLHYPCYWWKTDVKYKISQCLIGLHDLKQAQGVLKHALAISRDGLGDNCRRVIEMRKLLDDINRQIGASKDSYDSE